MIAVARSSACRRPNGLPRCRTWELSRRTNLLCIQNCAEWGNGKWDGVGNDLGGDNEVGRENFAERGLDRRSRAKMGWPKERRQEVKVAYDVKKLRREPSYPGPWQPEMRLKNLAEFAKPATGEPKLGFPMGGKNEKTLPQSAEPEQRKKLERRQMPGEQILDAKNNSLQQ